MTQPTLSKTPPEAPQQPAAPVYNLAGPGQRLGAYLLDYLILIVPMYLLILMPFALGVDPDENAEVTTADLILLLGSYVGVVAVWLGYFGWSNSRGGERNGQTLGKQALNIRVVRDDGRAIGFWFGLGRDGFIRPIIGGFTFWIGYLWSLWDESNRNLYDIVLSTHVVQTTTSAPVQYQPQHAHSGAQAPVQAPYSAPAHMSQPQAPSPVTGAPQPSGGYGPPQTVQILQAGQAGYVPLQAVAMAVDRSVWISGDAPVQAQAVTTGLAYISRDGSGGLHLTIPQAEAASVPATGYPRENYDSSPSWHPAAGVQLQ